MQMLSIIALSFKQIRKKVLMIECQITLHLVCIICRKRMANCNAFYSVFQLVIVSKTNLSTFTPQLQLTCSITLNFKYDT